MTSRAKVAVFARLREARRDDGFTLVEVMAAIVVFAIVAAAAVAGLVTGIRASADVRNRSAAAQVAAEQLEKDRSTANSSFASITPPGIASFTYTANNVTFTVKRTTEWIPKSTVGNGCDAAANDQGGNSGVEPVLLDTESVTWPTMGNDSPITTQTTFTPPVGLYSGTGGIDIGVVDHADAPVSGLTVTVVNQSTNQSQTLTTDSNGCAFAAYLTAATYKVSLNQSGYVDTNESNTSTCTQSINNNVLACSFVYDKAGFINWSYQSGCTAGTTTIAAANCPPVTGLNTVIVGNSGLNASGQYTNTYTPVTASTSLFPFTSGYNIWAGHCPAAVVNGSGTTTTGSVVDMTPGGTTTATVPLYQLAIALQSRSGQTYTLKSVSVAEDAASGSLTCSGTQTYTFPSAALDPSVQQAGVPAGTFDLTVTAATSGGSTVTGTISNPVTVTSNGATATVTLP